MYVVCETRIDPKTGIIALNTAHGLFLCPEAAKATMSSLNNEALKTMGLEDNNACDKNGESTSGGYLSDREAGVYDYADFAFGQLLELVNFTVLELKGGLRNA